MTELDTSLEVTRTAFQWIQLIGLGGLAGVLGQGMRTIVGLKKLADAAHMHRTAVSELLSISRLTTSLAIGFIAGALAAISSIVDQSNISTEQILALSAAGYAGADFIEGFMSRNANSFRGPNGEFMAQSSDDGAAG